MKKALLICLISLFMIINIYAQKKTRVAVLNFSPKGVSEDFTGAIVENLITALIDSGVFEVIERSQLRELMKELSLQNSDDFNDKLRTDLGNLYGVELVILGSVTKIGRNITTNVRGVEVSTGIAKFAKSFTTTNEDEIPKLIEELVSIGIVLGREVKKDDKKAFSEREIEEEIKEKPTNYDNRFKTPMIVMKVNAAVWLPIGITTVTLGFTFWLAQFLVVRVNNNPDLAIFPKTAEELNQYAENAYKLRDARNVMFIIGGLTLPIGIICAALAKYFKNRYEGRAINYNRKKNNRICALDFDIGLNKDDVLVALRMSF